MWLKSITWQIPAQGGPGQWAQSDQSLLSIPVHHLNSFQTQQPSLQDQQPSFSPLLCGY